MFRHLQYFHHFITMEHSICMPPYKKHDEDCFFTFIHYDFIR
jgi:hypothetical protein